MLFLVGCATSYQNSISEFPLFKRSGTKIILNQGTSSLCVGYAIATALLRSGVKLTPKEINTLYEKSREYGSIKEEEEGTLFRFFLKVLGDSYPSIRYGKVGLSSDGIKAALLRYGVVLVGLTHVDFSDIKKWRRIKKAPEMVYFRFGLPEGHAVVIDGWDEKNNFSIVNSYGERWGNKGKAWISASHLRAGLLEAYWITVK
jgi:hypothetical protein